MISNNLDQMNLESTRTIYSLLTETFWTAHQCSKCQISFTPQDYQTQNYQLYFTQSLKVEQTHLLVTVQLSHQQCCPDCLNFIAAIKTNDPKKKITPTNRNY
jgi:hypothetical protein